MAGVGIRRLSTAQPDFEAEFQRLQHWSAETDAAIETRVAEIIADGGSADGDPPEVGMAAHLAQVGVIHPVREVVAGQFRAPAPVVGAVVDEPEHVHPRGLPILPGHEVIAEGLGGEGETQSGCRTALERIRRPQ